MLTMLVFGSFSYAGEADVELKKGWAALVKDDDLNAIRHFGAALEIAREADDQEAIGTALLHLGICSYSVSYSKGLEYANSALKAFELLEKRNPEKALVGRSRCLQLISTIYTRQGKYREAIGLSKEAQLGFKPGKDSTGTLGLIYSSLGSAYQTLGKLDSTEYYYRKALEEQLLEKNETYLPTAYLKVAELEMTQGDSLESQQLQAKARAIAFRTGNRQAQVMVLLAEYKWQKKFFATDKEARLKLDLAGEIAKGLSDKSFLLKCLQLKADWSKENGDFKKALEYEEIIQGIRDTLYTRDKEETIKRLEVEFEVSEKDREIRIIRQEKDIAQLTNSLLWVIVISLLVLAIGVVGFQRKINRRNKQILETRESLYKAEEEKKILKEKQLQNELEFKESQISAMALQMLQKNELMTSLKEQLEKQGASTIENDLNRILNRSDYQDKEWSDFNIQFESLNKNFYTRLKEAYPEISPNDLKLCALIKLNMSIKEMAGILNISPDSVKTARYRLRKKLKMNSEDNLTEFILAL
ncbi:MAG TPA: hypothetical protein PL185_12900 [Flavobacteriales bacterium]|nr:hypothetical protein [Flavobacteriales bacterium]